MIDKRIATRISIIIIIIVLSFGLGGLSAFAQFSSGIEGIAHDQSGAVIAGATVTVTDTRLGVVKTVTTSQAGYFRIDSIAASTYTVQIASELLQDLDPEGSHASGRRNANPGTPN